MKNILVITIGNSDIQICKPLADGFSIEENILKSNSLPSIELKNNRGDHNCFLLSKPRFHGELIVNNFDTYKAILQFPLIDPLLEYLSINNISFQEVWWVYTDQEDVNEMFANNDTLYFKSAIQKYFEERFQNITYIDCKISKNVNDIDFQYQAFYKNLLSSFENLKHVNQIYLLAQGGVDQVNLALTLQLVQYYKEKVFIFQTSENKTTVDKKEFTHLFLKDLTKQAVIKHLQDYDFDKASDLILEDGWMKKICKYASFRLNMNTSDASIIFKNFSNKDKSNFTEQELSQIGLDWNKLSKVKQNFIKLSDLIIFTKILYTQGKFSDFLIKIFSINENLCKVQIENGLGLDFDTLKKFVNRSLKSEDINESWEAFLNSLDDQLIQYLKSKGVWLNNPNRKSYLFIYKYLVEKNRITNKILSTDFNHFNTVIEDFSGRRNGIAHNLGSVQSKDIQDILNKNNYSVERMFQVLNKFHEIKDFGIYNVIQKKLLKQYGVPA